MSRKGYFRLILFIIIILVTSKIVDNYAFFISITSKLLHLLSPLFWGVGIAYVLNPPMMILEKKFPKHKRVFSLLVVYAIFIGILVIFFVFVGPEIIKNTIDLTERLLIIWNNSYDYISDLLEELSTGLGIDLSFLNINENTFPKILEFFNTTFNHVFFTALNITKGFFTFVLGIFVSLYLLSSKERYLANTKKYVFAFLGKDKSKIIYNYAAKINIIFKNFLVGKFIDSLIVGIICFIGFTLLKINYAFLFSLIVGITNMIPYFGPFIGAVPAFVITLFFSPVQAIWVAIFLLALQQFDGWYLGPAILSESVGTSPLFIILAILIGGGFFGPIGMLLAVPTFKSVSIIWNDYIESRIKRGDISKKSHLLSDINININMGNHDENKEK